MKYSQLRKKTFSSKDESSAEDHEKVATRVQWSNNADPETWSGGNSGTIPVNNEMTHQQSTPFIVLVIMFLLIIIVTISGIIFLLKISA